MMHVERSELIEQTIRSIRHYPVTALIGPRQCGKTTLAREIFKDTGGHYFDLEDPETPLNRDIAKRYLGPGLFSWH